MISASGVIRVIRVIPRLRLSNLLGHRIHCRIELRWADDQLKEVLRTRLKEVRPSSSSVERSTTNAHKAALKISMGLGWPWSWIVSM